MMLFGIPKRARRHKSGTCFQEPCRMECMSPLYATFRCHLGILKNIYRHIRPRSINIDSELGSPNMYQVQATDMLIRKGAELSRFPDPNPARYQSPIAIWSIVDPSTHSHSFDIPSCLFAALTTSCTSEILRHLGDIQLTQYH